MYYLTVLEAQGVGGVSCGWFLLRVVWENLFHASSQASSGLLAIFGIRWLVDASVINLCLRLHVAFSICVHVCVQISLL